MAPEACGGSCWREEGGRVELGTKGHRGRRSWVRKRRKPIKVKGGRGIPERRGERSH